MTSFLAPEDTAGERLDTALAEAAEISRSRARQWVAAGCVTVDGQSAKPAQRLRVGQRIDWMPPAPPDDRIEATAGELNVLLEDPDFVVIDKPSGLTVHPGAGRPHGTLAHRLLFRYPEMSGVGGPGRPGIVHRLDKDTTGVMVAARTERGYAALAAAFAERRVSKSYLAVTYGSPRPEAGLIDQPIGRHRARRKEMTVRPDGRPARTGYETLAAAAGLSVLALTLHTGRTHQIRVHLKWAGHPLIGDPVYGEQRYRQLPVGARKPVRDFARPALHARTLGFAHPATGADVSVQAPVPADLEDLWSQTTGLSWPG